MENKLNLTEGNILNILIKLSLPIMGTSFIQMSCNLINMIYLGRLSSSSVAAVGTAGFFTWLATGIIFIPRAGAEIGVSQSMGRGKVQDVKEYVKNTLQLDIILGIIYALILIVFRKQLIGFFNLGDKNIIHMAETYLVVISLGMSFYFINPVFTGIFNGYGDSKTPFKINTIGLLINIVVDPLIIFGIGPFPKLGVAGAAIGTIIGQFVVTIIFLYNIFKKTDLFNEVNIFNKPNLKILKKIFHFGLPVALQNIMFCIFAMIIARIVASFGDVAIAVQKVGSQIEALSWMTAEGFATAMGAYIGQNFGAKKWDRINKGYVTAMIGISAIGIATSLLLIVGGRALFSVFIPEVDVIPYGADYLKILGFSQLLMCYEITTAGAFNGLGKTIPPAVVGIVFTALRIPGAIWLSKPNMLGLNGIWWSISISSMLKGVVLTSYFLYILAKQNKAIKENRQLLKQVRV
ncbi:MATE family efflux transporter [Clostridium peptidivorans]|uniref:MATE family efflux transporter n=1 Tax=Clostridium peptidivorans TaxID=100174 RepID=UPI000BE39A48|nr:MATE family efflux transporter [Clostridium peptidivorans]